MKKRLFTLFAIVGLILAGCSNKIDTAKVRAGLQSIDDAHKVQLDQAITAIDAGKYGEAVLPLRKIANGAKLDQTQRDLLEDTLTKVKAQIAKGQ